MDLDLKIYDVDEENLQERLEKIAKEIDTCSNEVMHDGVAWKRKEAESSKLDGLNRKLFERRIELVNEVIEMAKHERDCGEDMSNDICYNQGYIRAIEYILKLLNAGGNEDEI